MIYELLEHLKARIESNTGFKALILPSVPAVYELNTAYIIVPEKMGMEFAITEQMFADFHINMYFVTSECQADDMKTMSKNVLKAYSSVSQLLEDVMPRGGRSYSDEDMDANCYDLDVSMKTWMTAGKIPISTRISTRWKAIIKG